MKGRVADEGGGSGPAVGKTEGAGPETGKSPGAGTRAGSTGLSEDTGPNPVVRREYLFETEGIAAEIVFHRVGGFDANALMVRLPGPRRSLGGRDGLKTIEYVFNCFLPIPLQQAFGERQRGWNGYFRDVTAACAGGEIPCRKRTILATGVDIAHLAWRMESAGGQWVAALATAGVVSNALRIGVDRACVIERSGRFEPVGTINIVILTNVSLTTAALAASMVTATEAKVIALQDLDIRSAYDPRLRASGTGTDQVLVVSGVGPVCGCVGGHTLLGEMMARAVTSSVDAALRKRHGM